ncbi:hypothetical protein [Burkholderia multivorans]|uniref:hypothetical protein n=1 Tax=Burkholderia multivorans TaxID=87883 RepID=UPI0013E0689E|nr:hypothetical protein [Burkholderia multivorans]MBU9618518.1 hypothetical protein [Burkholderia multivorans]NGM75359.1 hypothetical protein [Burkholderia multivorans]
MTGERRRPDDAAAVADLDAIDAADIRSQVDTANAAGAKEWLRWNTLDRYDVSGPPR